MDSARRLMRSQTGMTALAQAAAPLLRRLPATELERLGWRGADHSLDNAARVLERLAETGNAVLLFGGATPSAETRPFVRGASASGRLEGVLLTLGPQPPVDLAAYDHTVYLLREDLGAWHTTELPGALFEAARQQAAAASPVASPVATSPEQP